MSHETEELTFAIITCSDTRTIEEDTAGKALEEDIIASGWKCKNRIVVSDEQEKIAQAIIDQDVPGVDIILTCGGTGFSPRDVTPEATKMVCHRDAPGIAEAIRYLSYKFTNRAMLSRAVAMQRISEKGITLVINLPGSQKGAMESFSVVKDVLPHAISMSHMEGH